MADQDNLIGLGRCPICSNLKARFTVSKKSLACMTCNACNVQIFARSDSSDEKLRSFINPVAQAVEPAPAAPAAPEKTPAVEPVAEEKKPPKKPAFSWGILRETA